jgi:predicted histidine transporter YuiF (NhaC family)
MRKGVSFKFFIIIAVLIMVLGLFYNFMIYNKTQKFIKKHNCQETTQIRYSSDSEGNVESTIKYTCDNGDFWLNDYHKFKSFFAIFED